MGITSKAELASGLKTLHANANLSIMLETFQNYEFPDEVLQEKMWNSEYMYLSCTITFFKLSEESKDTILVDKLLNKEAREPKSTGMDVHAINPLTTSLRTLKLSSVEKFIAGFKALEI